MKEVKLFSELFKVSNGLHRCCSILEDLNPTKLSIKKILSLSDYVLEVSSQVNNIDFPHISFFGTGGDKFKTVNLSTLAAIRASRFQTICKISTVNVTSKHGSQQFIQVAEKYSLRLRILPPSSFAFVSELGFPYSPNLRNARKTIFRYGIPDICKIIFPFTNFSNATCQITGASSAFYEFVLIRCYKCSKKNAIVVHSLRGCDELMPGLNRLTKIQNGKVKQWEYLLDPGISMASIAERDSINEQVDYCEKELSDRSSYLSIVVDWNAAVAVLAEEDSIFFYKALEQIRESSLVDTIAA